MGPQFIGPHMRDRRQLLKGEGLDRGRKQEGGMGEAYEGKCAGGGENRRGTYAMRIFYFKT